MRLFDCWYFRLMKDAFQKRIGILGGGQLGRMIIQEAINYNLFISVLDPDPNAPCSVVANEHVVGDFKEYQSVMDFGKNCDLVTIEIENVNTRALKDLAKSGIEVYPEPAVIEIIKDKRKQKTFYKANRIPTSEFMLVEGRKDIEAHVDFLPFVNKLGTAGYDGRGVKVLQSDADLAEAFDQPGLIEKYIPFEKELAMIVARNKKGEIKTYPLVEMVFNPVENLVEYLFSPANVDGLVHQKAESIARDIISKLNMTGLLAVELFLDKENNLLVNEIAPRVHNSGHHTIESCASSQFDQFLRSILNLPLGNTDLRAHAAMINLLGSPGHKGLAKYQGVEETLGCSNAFIHLYGKKETRPFRKMGHLTVIADSHEALLSSINDLKKAIKIIS